MSNTHEEHLWDLLKRNRDRLQWIADREAQAAMLRRGGSVESRFDNERETLINQADEILSKLEKCYKNA